MWVKALIKYNLQFDPTYTIIESFESGYSYSGHCNNEDFVKKLCLHKFATELRKQNILGRDFEIIDWERR